MNLLPDTARLTDRLSAVHEFLFCDCTAFVRPCNLAGSFASRAGTERRATAQRSARPVVH